MTNRDTLLKRLQICDFTLTEVALYLDTHPRDKEALAYYHKYLALQKEAKEEYVRKYGPIVHSDQQSESKWEWVNDPWPWENCEV